MTLLMAEKDQQPMLRDFLGLNHHMGEAQPPPAEFPSSDMLRVSSSGGGPSLKVEVDPETSAAAPPTTSRGKLGPSETRHSPDFVSAPFGLALPSSSEQARWQQSKAGALQHHGIKSAFYKPALDGSKLAKKRESPGGRESLQDRLVEALESSRCQKTARIDKQKNEKVVDHRESPPSANDLHLSMQPPRHPSKSPTWYQQNLKLDVSNRQQQQRKKTECSKPPFSSSPGLLPMRGGIGHGSAFTETVAAVATPPPPPPKENSPQIGHQVVAEDEGSRTGLKTRSSLVGLLSSAGLLHDSAAPAAAAAAATGSSGPPPSTPQRLKASSRSGGSMLPSGHQVASPTSRQLTIFYGGQAHVYDDIPPEKAQAIMALAGSNGRSWCTTYSPRPTGSVPDSTASEDSWTHLEKNKDQAAGKSLSGGSLSLCSEVQTLLRGLAKSGIGKARPL
ncbi:hypothetical protein BDL97_08G107900 [Sphagnum fallax]|nr:hypothetical protein BDL97_08G107900 [Sphagnum fallax]